MQQHSTEESILPPGEIVSTSPANLSMACCFKLLRFFNTFAITILSVMVGWIFFQLQYVHYELGKESDRIDDLLKQIRENQSHEIDQLNQRVDENQSIALYQMSGIFVVLVALITMFHMSTHLRNYHEPIVQRKIITILWMSPIYAVTSFFSLVFPSADGYLAVIRDFYEAYVVYNFLSFLIAVLGRGNREVVVDVLAKHADHLAQPARCLQSFYYPPPDSSDKALANAVLFECQVLAMQFVFFRPLTSVANFVSLTVQSNNGSSHSYNTDDNDEESPWAYFLSPGFYIAMFTNITVFLAFRGLLRFYHAAAHDLQWLQPFSKFMAIKGIVFLTFWQGLLISIFVNLHSGATSSKEENTAVASGVNTTTSATGHDDNKKSAHEQAQEIQNVLICLEMLFFSIAHWCVFPADEWEPGYRPKEFAKPGLGLQDFARDVKYIISSRRRRHVEDGGDASDHATGSESDVVEEAEVVVLDALALDEHDDEEMVREVNHRRGTPYQVAPQESGSLT